MKDAKKPTPRRHKLGLVLALVLMVAVIAGIWSHRVEAGSTTGPDVTVIYLGSTSNYGAVSGVRAYSVGTTSCNVGDEPIWWCDNDRAYCDDDQHPVIAQNLYRLKDGRFEQIGMSWLKHGFLSTNSTDSNCGSCQGPPNGGDQLGVGCTDTYGSGLNGSRPLGMRSEVDATAGTFPFPYTNVGTATSIDQRLQVLETDVDPALNPGARYWVEGQYVTEDDAAAGNGLNNASYNEATVTGSNFNLNVTGSATVREMPAVYAWQAVDPTVEITTADVPTVPLERFHVARKATDLGGGSWHYEYVVRNMNSDRAARSLTVGFPGTTTITSVGFRDVDHHSGEPWATTDWGTNVQSNSVTWFTDTFAADSNANALRWGTMFTFWFDADRGPTGLTHTLGLFKDGSPGSISFGFGLEEIFSDGFESGNTSAWSSAVP